MRILLFVEDAGHEAFIVGLVERVCRELEVSAEIFTRNAVGGKGSALRTLRQYVRDMRQGRERFAEILVVAIDGNCQGPQVVAREIREIVEGQQFAGICVCAVPDPHVEVWYLADGRAIRRVLEEDGAQPGLPEQKCEPDRYKQLLREAFLDLDIDPPAGGTEYGGEIAEALDVERATANQPTLRSFVDDLRAAIRVSTVSS